LLALIPLLPFLGFLVNATLGRRLPKSVSGGIAITVVIVGTLLAVVIAIPLSLLAAANELSAAKPLHELDRTERSGVSVEGLSP